MYTTLNCAFIQERQIKRFLNKGIVLSNKTERLRNKTYNFKEGVFIHVFHFWRKRSAQGLLTIYFQQSDPLSRPLIPERSKWALWQVLREMKIKCPPLPPNMKIANFVGNTRALKPRFLIGTKTCISLFLLLWDLKPIRLNTHQLNSNKIQS